MLGTLAGAAAGTGGRPMVCCRAAGRRGLEEEEAEAEAEVEEAALVEERFSRGV